ncbi:MAG: DegV family protein [Coriobacteriia bacterium]|nr:DegV family protein [Coriobacteriia bacterium]
MTTEKIAILVDSGSDVPREYREKYHMYVAPLTIIYKDREYQDGVDIDPQAVYDRFAEEIPSTSLPSPAVVTGLFKQIKADGYDKVIVVAISSGLSGTFNMLTNFGPSPEGLEAHYVDTKNIGIGSGFAAIRAGELIEQGLPFDEVCRGVEDAVRNTTLFFCVSTLEYLVKGGRIGLVAGMVGQLLNVKPVIACNEDGIYYTVGKARGREKSLRLALEKAVEFAEGATEYNIAVVQGAAEDEGTALMAAMKKRLPDFRYAIEEQLTPALVVHTGPGLIGIGVQRLA